jgi:hypothetical protein
VILISAIHMNVAVISYVMPFLDLLPENATGRGASIASLPVPDSSQSTS